MQIAGIEVDREKKDLGALHRVKQRLEPLSYYRY